LPEVAPAHSADANAGDVEFVAGRIGPKDVAGNEMKRKRGQSGIRQEFPAGYCTFDIVFHELVSKFIDCFMLSQQVWDIVFYLETSCNPTFHTVCGAHPTIRVDFLAQPAVGWALPTNHVRAQCGHYDQSQSGRSLNFNPEHEIRSLS
jgi:hypothetical protein